MKVVEGSEIYNFPIHHFVHFYSTLWSFTRLNRGTGALSASRATASRNARVRAAPAPRRTAARAPGAARHPRSRLPSPRTLPRRARMPRHPRTPRCPRPVPRQTHAGVSLLPALPDPYLLLPALPPLRSPLPRVGELLYKAAAGPPAARRTTQLPTVLSAGAKAE
jgi:hypothetical protein